MYTNVISGKNNLTHSRCLNCKGLFWKKNINAHMRNDCLHSVVRLNKFIDAYRCGLCTEKFTEKLELLEHYKSSHTVELKFRKFPADRL